MQSQVMPQAANTVIVRTVPANNSSRRENYAATQSLWLGSIQVGVGILCMLFQIVAIIIHAEVAVVGAGIWCGILFIISGVFGITASKYKTNCHIITFMVMSIISAVFIVFLLACSSAGINYDRYTYRYYHYYSDYSDSRDSGRNGKLAMNSLLLILSLVECVVAIWSSAICCAGLCCNSGPQGGVVYGQAVQYQIPANGQQVVMINQPQGGYNPVQPGTAFIQVAQPMAPPAYSQGIAQPPMYVQPQQGGPAYPQQQPLPNQGQAQPIPQKQ